MVSKYECTGVLSRRPRILVRHSTARVRGRRARVSVERCADRGERAFRVLLYICFWLNNVGNSLSNRQYSTAGYSQWMQKKGQQVCSLRNVLSIFVQYLVHLRTIPSARLLPITEHQTTLWTCVLTMYEIVVWLLFIKGGLHACLWRCFIRKQLL